MGTRKAQFEDLSTLAGILDGNRPNATSHLEEALPNMWVATHQDRVVGCITLVPVISPSRRALLVEELFVAKEYRRMGFAKLLLDEAREQASGREFSRIEATFRNGNAESMGAFLHAGYVDRNQTAVLYVV